MWSPPNVNLYKHQEVALDLCMAKRRFGIFHDMGTGKTLALTTLYVNRCLQEKRLIPILILGPLSTVRGWYKTFIEFAPERMHKYIQVVDGNNWQVRVKQLNTPDKYIFISNIDLINSKAWKTAAEKKWEILTLDESHRFKDGTRDRTKDMIRLSDSPSISDVYLLSGTPTLNSYLDIFSQFRIMNHTLFGKNFSDFRARYFWDRNANMPKSSYFPAWEIRYDKFQDFQKIISDNSHRVMKEDVIELPEFVTKNIYIDMLGQQRKHYNELLDRFVTVVDDDAVSVDMKLTQVMRLLQITCGVLATDDSGIKYVPTCKIDMLRELVLELSPKEKIVIWSNFATTYKMISDELTKLKIGHTFYTGHQSAIEKEENKERFIKDPDCRCLIANQASGGTGTDGLQKVATVSIFFSRNHSLEQYLQSIDRLRRSGADLTKKITVINLIANDTMEEDVHESLLHKKSEASLLFKLKEKYGLRYREDVQRSK